MDHFTSQYDRLKVNKALETYAFHEAVQILYHFFWDDFCDWYIELAKDEITAGNIEARTRILDGSRTGSADAASVYAVSDGRTCGRSFREPVLRFIIPRIAKPRRR